MNLRIWTWNVNSIRNKIDLVKQLLEKHNIDILVITETKIQIKHEKDLGFWFSKNRYKIIWNTNKLSYHHGIAIIYKEHLNISFMYDYLPYYTKFKLPETAMKNYSKLINVTNKDIIKDIGCSHFKEGRILTVMLTINEQEKVVIVGTYVPNAGVDRSNPLKRLAYRVLSWDKDMSTFLLLLEKEYKNVIWLGDLNVARKNNDIASRCANYAGTTPEERSNFNSFLDESKWIDTWDYLNPNKINIKERYTFGGCLLRLDYVICSLSLKNKLKTSYVDHQFEGSDHNPVGTDFVF